ncbi:MAG: hypothetical protein ABWZ83_12995 [Mesorhizobium sp.]|jgi:hypothetical protein
MKICFLATLLAVTGCAAGAVAFRADQTGTTINGSLNGKAVALRVEPDGATTGTIGGQAVSAWTDADGRTTGAVGGRPFSCYRGVCA